jgi:hypothetical protein
MSYSGNGRAIPSRSASCGAALISADGIGCVAYSGRFGPSVLPVNYSPARSGAVRADFERGLAGAADLRMARQQILGRPNAPRFNVVLDEASLRRASQQP